MKTILILLLLSCLSFHTLLAQEGQRPKFEIGYGYGFLARAAPTNNILLQANIFQKRKWQINAEFSATFGGPWAFVFGSDSGSPLAKGSQFPDRVFAFAVGMNAYRAVLKKRSLELGYSAGFLVGYERYDEGEIIEYIQTQRGGSITARSDIYEGPSVIIPIRLIATKLFKKRSISLSPAFYYMGKAKGNAVLFLTMGF